MMLIAGTIPIEALPLTTGRVKTEGDLLNINGHRFPCTQGTGAMISAALATTGYLKLESPQALVAGDTGQGKGSREIYHYLIEHIAKLAPAVLALHYCVPDMALTRRLCQALKGCAKRPLLIADAASMYSAKASGLAEEFDIFTPDATEMAFLADPDATHPAYIQKHLFDTDVTQTPKLVSAAYRQKNAARLLMVKGKTDYVVRGGEIIDTITEPDVPEMEAIGGTGDTITGMIAALVYGELEPHEAAIIAARANRTAGKMAQVTPATKIKQVVDRLPLVFKENLCQWSGVCYIEGGNQND